jgi:hypothetical protein
MVRRSKGVFWGAWYSLVYFLRSRLFALRLRWAGHSEGYIAEAFSYLVQLDMTEWMRSGNLRVKGAGIELHVVEERPTIKVMVNKNIPEDCVYLLPPMPGEEPQYTRLYEFVMFQDHNGQLVVHEWREETRDIPMSEKGLVTVHKTHWHEVYRSGKHFESLRFVKYLHILYGLGPAKEGAGGLTAQERVKEYGEQIPRLPNGAPGWCHICSLPLAWPVGHVVETASGARGICDGCSQKVKQQKDAPNV